MYLYEYAREGTTQAGMCGAAVISAVVHYLVFALWKTDDPKSAPFRSRVASQVHAVFGVVSVACAVALLSVDFSSKERMVLGVAEEGDWVHPYIIAVSVGYFASDMVVMLTHPDVFAPSAIIHHTVIGGGFAAGLVTGVATPYHVLFLAEEASTVFLNIRYFWRKNPNVQSKASLAFAAAFFVSRLLFGSYVFLSAFPFLHQGLDDGILSQAQYTAFSVQVFLCALSRLLNLFWAYQILRILIAPAKPKSQ